MVVAVVVDMTAFPPRGLTVVEGRLVIPGFGKRVTGTENGMGDKATREEWDSRMKGVQFEKPLKVYLDQIYERFHTNGYQQHFLS